tara:strand:- start:1203 stop:1553 length:351 start_codon:yes stop_codon:yes gene_type:complete
MAEKKIIFNNTAYYVKKEDDFIKKLMDEILNQEKQFLTKYKKLSKSNNLTDISKMNELNKQKSLLKFKKDSYEKQIIVLKKLVEYINYLNDRDMEIENIKLLINNIVFKINDYSDI